MARSVLTDCLGKHALLTLSCSNYYQDKTKLSRDFFGKTLKLWVL